MLTSVERRVSLRRAKGTTVTVVCDSTVVPRIYKESAQRQTVTYSKKTATTKNRKHFRGGQNGQGVHKKPLGNPVSSSFGIFF